VELVGFERGWLEYLEAEITRQDELSRPSGRPRPRAA
jgi:hypothetical protein